MSDHYGGLPPAPPPPPSDWRPGYGHFPKPPCPPSVRSAVRLMYVQVLLSLVGLVVILADKNDLKSKIRDNTPNATDSTVDAAITVAIVIGAVFLVLYALLARQVSKGRNWARIVTWVFAGLGILSGLVNLGQPTTPISRVIGIISLLVAIAIVVLLARKQSHPYFRS